MEPSDYKAQRMQKVTLRTVILGGLMFVGMFVYMVYPALFGVITRSQLGENPQSTVGVVLSTYYKGEGRDYTVNYRYSALSPEGQMTEYEGSDHLRRDYNESAFRPDDPIEILYNPEAPHISLSAEHTAEMDWIPLLCLPICGLFGVFAFIVLVFGGRMIHKNDLSPDEQSKTKGFQRPPSSPPPISR